MVDLEYGQMRTENSNKPHGFGVLNPATFTPFPKNPVIGAFFREIHRADELGSGMRKMELGTQIRQRLQAFSQGNLCEASGA